jgi:hypothetical protein
MTRRTKRRERKVVMTVIVKVVKFETCFSSLVLVRI